MKFTGFRFLALFLSVFVISSGCTKSNLPKDFPKLYPCEITVIQDGEPLPECNVALLPSDGSNAKYGSSALTNDDGTALINTYGHAGVPSGSYIVTMEKTAIEDAKQVTNSEGDQVEVGGQVYSYVAEIHTNPETSPHRIEIGKSQVSARFDIGKKVHDFVQEVPML